VQIFINLKIVNFCFVIHFQLWFVEFLMTKDDVNIISKLKSSRAKAHKWFRDFLFTWSAMMIFFILLKSIYGEHRPHFIEMCVPDAVNCTKGSLVTNFTCTNPNLSNIRLKEISRSFPSGHAALAVYFSVFISWFLEQRLPKLRTKYLVPFLQAALAVYAMICCTSRITDNAHHDNDVLFGILFGIGFSTFNVSLLSLV
jgi:phosphatidate phosphatase